MADTYELPGGDKYRPKYPDSPFIHIADLVDSETGKTYREMNAERQHEIPIGALVEILSDEYDDSSAGVRLYVVNHGRDCDMTPLYYLSHERYDTEQERDGWKNRSWVGGYSAESLDVIQLPTADEGSDK